MQRLTLVFTFLLILLSTSWAAQTGQYSYPEYPLFRTTPVNFLGEPISFGAAVDKNTFQHVIRDFSSTLLVNGVQTIFTPPKHRYKIPGRTSLIVVTSIVVFEVGQSTAGHYIGLIDIGVGIMSHIISNKISKLIFKL